jgi:phosphoribosylformylglycinamidine cyclo-ligase
MKKGKFDIAGFAVGVVDEDKILDKRKIKSGDLILAIPPLEFIQMDTRL